MKPGWNKAFKKLVLLLLAFSLIAPQAALAEEGVSVPKWQFGDMAESHWATKYVRKIGLLGITTGDNLGNYNPSKNITRQEAVMMVINLLGLQEEVETNTVQVNLGFEVSPWAEKHVKYAVVKGLIDLRDESENVAPSGAWGTVSASREWIAKLVVKALGKDAEAAERDGEYTGFADDAAISDGYSGYVNVVKNLGIMVGDNQNRFNPAASITRAEMAVVFGKAVQLSAANHSRIVTGTLDAVNLTSITLRTSSGIATYQLADNAVFYTYESNNPILPSNLARGDSILLIQYGGTAYYVEKTEKSVQYETIVGEYVNIYTDTAGGQSMRIAVLVDGETQSYPFTPGITTFTKEDGTGVSTSELTPGSILELSRVAGTEQITSVIVKKTVERKTVSGLVERIFADQRLLEVRDPQTGERQPLYTVAADAAIWSGSRQISLSDLHAGDEVSLYLADGIVEEIVVVKSAVTTVEGLVHKVDASLRVIYLSGTPIVGYEVETGAAISISGLSAPKLGDIQTGDEVVLELNGKQRVQKITVLNRSIEAHMGVEFFGFDEKTNSLSYRDGDELVIKKVTPETVIEYGSAVLNLNQINSNFRQNDKIDLIITGDRLVRMSYSKTYAGTLKQISTRTNTIVLEADEFGEVSFTYTNAPIVFMFGKTNATLSDLLIGNRIQIELDPTQSKVQYISVVQKQLFKVKEKLTYKLVVTDESGKSYEINNPSSARFTHYDKLYATYADVEAGGYVMVTFTGSQATDIYIARAAYGIVQSVDTAQNTFSFAEYGKDARTVDNNLSLVIDGKTSPVSALKAGDRIYLVEGDDGLRLVSILVKQQRKVSLYIPGTNSLQLITNNLQEQNVYSLNGVFLHQSGTPISATTLKRNDVVNLYFHGTLLVEVEKQ